MLRKWIIAGVVLWALGGGASANVTLPPGCSLGGCTMGGAIHMGANTLDGSAVTFTGGTLTGLTHAGGVLSGTFTGAPTLSGAVTLSGGGALGGTFSGSFTLSGTPTMSSGVAVIGTGAGTFSALDLVAANTKTRYLALFTGTTGGTGSRWNIGANTTSESGANAGSDFVVEGRSDTGTLLGDYLTITRSSGLSTFTGTVTAPRFLGPSSISFVNTLTSAPFLFAGNVSGNTVEVPQTLLSGLQIANDTVTTTGNFDVFQALDNVRAGATGSRISLHGKMNILGTPGNSSNFYVPIQADAFANVPLSSAAIDGVAVGALLATGATGGGSLIGLELSAGVETGADSASRIILSIEAQGTEAVRGTLFDAGISFNRGGTGTTPGLGYGIAFGHPTQSWFFASDSCLICAIPRTAGPNRVPLLADVGVDYTKVFFTTASLKLPGATFDNTGQLNIANASITRTSTGVALDVPNLIITAGAAAAAGTGYVVNDLVYETTSGTMFLVATINGSGGITGLTVKVPGYLAAAPGGALALFAGSGQNGTVTLTTASRKELALNPGGGDITVAGLATSAPATHCALWVNAGVLTRTTCP